MTSGTLIDFPIIMNAETPCEIFKTEDCPGMRKATCSSCHSTKFCLKVQNAKIQNAGKSEDTQFYIKIERWSDMYVSLDTIRRWQY